MKRIISQIRLSRRALRHDYTGSFIVLEKSIRNASELNMFLEKAKARIELKYEARNHLIISSVSCADIFLKLVAVDFIKSLIYVDDSLKNQLKKYTFNLQDVLELQAESVTVGEIIYATKSFYDLGEIEKFFSSLAGKSEQTFRARIESSGVDMGNKIIAICRDYPDYRQVIGEIMSMRHRLIHHGKLKRMPSLKKLNASVDTLLAYLASLSNLMEFYREEKERMFSFPSS
jgi:hypothetical protein